MSLSSLSSLCLYLNIHFYLNSLYTDYISSSFSDYNHNTIFSFVSVNSLSFINENVVVIIVSNDVFKKFISLKNLKENLNK